MNLDRWWPRVSYVIFDRSGFFPVFHLDVSEK